ncbi:sucrase ferredoxin [Pseudoroseicyclus tamaricis]|uniref:Sucrase ferredoxin n=1 Tax=Pseudoroseicyclus tamaricis TaxID=2705421 RepID=A0A6B2K3P5_9RHOB|nr:sucrase ferredoxin [Pseudoroseicyclus tamaricis]NDV01226.1 sucrase ferredoxin [Pseudoroseicyclus tamaricis]
MSRFCSERSLAAGEPLAGTGIHPARNLLIQWPKAKWRHSLRIAADMDEALVTALEDVVAAGWRVNLIDRKGESRETLQVFLYPEALSFELRAETLPAFLAAIPMGVDALAPFGPKPARTPLVLCCTHGKHDRCCAKFGFALYRAMAGEAEARGDFDVWEATHLGGCRLAASVLVLPSMRKYGRLAPADAPALLSAEAAGLPYLKCYRGASHLDGPAQVAEVAGLQHLASQGICGTATLRETGAGRYAVTVGASVAHVSLTEGSMSGHGTCSDIDGAKPPATKTIWLASVEPLREATTPNTPPTKT